MAEPQAEMDKRLSRRTRIPFGHATGMGNWVSNSSTPQQSQNRQDGEAGAL